MYYICVRFMCCKFGVIRRLRQLGVYVSPWSLALDTLEVDDLVQNENDGRKNRSDFHKVQSNCIKQFDPGVERCSEIGRF